MRVSVVIPCFKDALTLGRALDSVFAQSRAVDEVIVVNDASPETSAIENVLSAYPCVKYVINETNLGLAATRNAGVHAATSEIVTFLDADDELHPQKIELQLLLYRSDRAVSCKVARIGNEIGMARVERYPGYVKYTVQNDSARLVRRNTLTGASLMVSRDLFLSVGGYDRTLRSCEDFDLWLRLLDLGVPVFNIEQSLYLYRVNENGLSRNLLNISYWELEAVKKYFGRHRSAGTPLSSEGITLTFWLFKHLVRYEQCQDRELIDATCRNIDLLKSWPFLHALLIFAKRTGLPRAAYVFLVVKAFIGKITAFKKKGGL